MINPGECHVYAVKMAQKMPVYGGFWQTLADEEKQRAERFKFDVHRERFVVSHGVLRQLLAHYLQSSPQEIEFKTGHHGKPALLPTSALHFNMSHSEDCVVYAFTQDCDIGIDVEYAQRPVEYHELAKRFFADSEAADLAALSEEHVAQGFFNAWTRKEAFIKAVGEGLSYPLKDFEVTLSPGEPAKLLSIKNEDANQWCLQAFTPFENYVAAIAAKSPKIVCFFKELV